MKLSLNLLLLFIGVTAFSQSKSDSLLLVKTEWINNNLDYIRFDADTITYNIANTRHDLYFDLGKRTLTMKERFYYGGTGIKEEAIQFKIKNLDKNKLVIYPLDEKVDLDQEGLRKLTYEPFYTKKEFTFYNRQNAIEPIDFKKITFISSTCFGTCPSFSLEINRDGSFFYQGRIYAKKFTGNFKGKLSKQEMVTLHKLLNRSRISTINKKWNQNTKPVDNPRFNYMVELANGEIIEISTNDQHPILDKLSEYFINLPDITELTKTNKKHNFEKPKVNAYKIVGIEE